MTSDDWPESIATLVDQILVAQKKRGHHKSEIDLLGEGLLAICKKACDLAEARGVCLEDLKPKPSSLQRENVMFVWYVAADTRNVCNDEPFVGTFCPATREQKFYLGFAERWRDEIHQRAQEGKLTLIERYGVNGIAMTHPSWDGTPVPEEAEARWAATLYSYASNGENQTAGACGMVH